MGKKFLALGACMLMLLLVVSGSGCIFPEEKQEETTPQQEEQTGTQQEGQSGTWHYVTALTGDNTQTGDSFYYQGKKQKVEWSYQGVSEYGSWMYWYLIDEEGNTVGTGGSSSDEGYASDSGVDYVYCGPGNYAIGISESQASYEVKTYTYY